MGLAGVGCNLDEPVVPRGQVVQHVRSNNYTVRYRSYDVDRLYVPFALGRRRLSRLSGVVRQGGPVRGNRALFGTNSRLGSLCTVHSNAVGDCAVARRNSRRVANFRLTNSLIKFSTVNDNRRPDFTRTLRASVMYRVPFRALSSLSNGVPGLHRRVVHLVDNRVGNSRSVVLLLSGGGTRRHLTTFVCGLSHHFTRHNFSPHRFHLAVAHNSVNGCLNLAMRAVDHLLNHFRGDNVLTIGNGCVAVRGGSTLTRLTNRAHGIT